MDVTEAPEGRVRVRCPLCRLERVYDAGEGPERFEHVSSECPIATVIELAIEQYRFAGEEVHG